MADYIDRIAIRDALYDADAITMRGVAMLNKFPAADVVKVVRCRDCKYCMLWNNATDTGIGDCRIRIMNSCCVDFVAVRDEDYCSYAERRSDP